MPYIHAERRLHGGGALRAYDDDLAYLYDSGIRAIVSLLSLPADQRLYEDASFSYLCLPIPDGFPPSLEQTQRFVKFLAEQQQQDRAVAVHCAAGRGRTGTMLAAYLIFQGVNWLEATARVRASEPGAVETVRQMEFLKDFGNLLGDK
ncbi:MAG TPA: dual specificity protein phosphatase family protein [Candidatus Saccharimonadales bacterium]|nr:dual specificity protein phosphatase family protein [Candidatus Saccharimonadales bacterium]